MSTRPAEELEIQEIAVYAWSGGLIREVWSTTDRLDARPQLGGTP